MDLSKTKIINYDFKTISSSDISSTVSACMEELGIHLDDKQLSSLVSYSKQLVEWNEHVNLTAITEDEKIAVLHFVDSLTLLAFDELKESSLSVIDVGTGAGFPGIPLKIALSSLTVTLLDSLNKRLNFLNAVADEAGIDINTVHARAEDGGKDKAYREQFDVAVSRAVANLPALCELCMPFVKVGGYFYAMKGSEFMEELEKSKHAIATLGGNVEEIRSFTLPDGSKRGIIKIKKISQTPSNYPRMPKKIAEKPL